MVEIVLGNGLVTTVDDEDHARIAAYGWVAHRSRPARVYARREHWDSGQRHRVYMHREILGVTDRCVEVDHINGNTLDNRRVNLRLCTHAENGQNRRRRRSGFVSQFKGVWRKGGGLWSAKIQSNRKIIRLGYFAHEREAAEAYNAAALRLHGAFACLNSL